MFKFPLWFLKQAKLVLLAYSARERFQYIKKLTLDHMVSGIITGTCIVQ